MTFEVTGAAATDVVELKLAGYKYERLDRVFINVMCEDQDADDLTSLLDHLGLEYRLI